MKINYLIIALAFIFFGNVSAQEPVSSPLYQTLKSNDSLLFDVGFNHCNLKAFEELLDEDLEFYHDKAGIINSKEQFISNFKNGLCKSDEVVSRRELVKGSIAVFPLYHNGELYGAIQKGEHKFYETPKGKTEQPGSMASFTHLWIKYGDVWKIKRVLSYNHQALNENQAKHVVSISEELLKSYAGTYMAEQTGRVIISVKDEHLFLKTKKMETAIYPESNQVFFHKQAPLTFEFIQDSKDETIELIVKENGITVEKATKTNQ